MCVIIACTLERQCIRSRQTCRALTHPVTLGKGRGRRAQRPRWYAVDIAADRDSIDSEIFDEAERRDPGHARPWIALGDGDIYQIGLFQSQAAERGIKQDDLELAA